MLTYPLEDRSGLPLYEFLCRCIRTDIEKGKLKPGEKLPSKRELAGHLGVSVVTVENAYAQLLLEGYLYAKERSGYFVEALILPPKRKREKPVSDKAPKSAPRWFADFRTNRTPPEQFPFSVWAKLMREVLTERSPALLEPMPGRGTLALREALCGYLSRYRGIEAHPEEIVVGAGTEFLYGLLVQLLGRDRLFAVEDPGYGRIAQAYLAGGAQVCPTPLDHQGLSVKALLETQASVVHLSPAHHFPTGGVMPVSRRRELSLWAQEKPGRFLIEDDYDSEFRFTGRPAPALKSIEEERTIYINTFSKSLTPAIRISFMVLPWELSRLYSQKLGFSSCTVSSFEQLTLAKFLNSGHFESHLARTRNFYRRKRDALLAAIEESSLKGKSRVLEENAGLHFLLQVDTGLSDEELVGRAQEKGVAVSCLSQYYHEPLKAPEHCLVINYTGVESERMREAADLLGSCL